MHCQRRLFDDIFATTTDVLTENSQTLRHQNSLLILFMEGKGNEKNIC